jgi:hypothetical protein
MSAQWRFAPSKSLTCDEHVIEHSLSWSLVISFPKYRDCIALSRVDSRRTHLSSTRIFVNERQSWPGWFRARSLLDVRSHVQKRFFGVPTHTSKITGAF